MSSRIDALKQLVNQDPQNSFTRYGLAMEYANSGDLEAALREFREVLAVNENYSAAYYHAGRTLERLGRLDEARRMYEDGIAATTRNGDTHTRSELQAALDLL